MAGLTDITKNGTQYEFMPRSTAGQFSTSTAYAVGDYCYFDGTLYRCTTAHAAGAFVASHFTAVTIDGELKAKETEIENVKSDLSNITDTVYPSNIYNQAEATDGCRLQSNGTTYTTADYFTSGYIDVSFVGESTLFFGTGNYALNKYFVCFYDADKKVISSSGAVSNSIANNASAKYMRFSAQTAYYPASRNVSVTYGTARKPYSAYFVPYVSTETAEMQTFIRASVPKYIVSFGYSQYGSKIPRITYQNQNVLIYVDGYLTWRNLYTNESGTIQTYNSTPTTFTLEPSKALVFDADDKTIKVPDTIKPTDTILLMTTSNGIILTGQWVPFLSQLAVYTYYKEPNLPYSPRIVATEQSAYAGDQSICELGDWIVCFNAQDSDGKIYVLNKETKALIKQMTHTLGHANMLSYCVETDSLMVSGSTTYILQNATAFIENSSNTTISPSDCIDCGAYIGVFGETKDVAYCPKQGTVDTLNNYSVTKYNLTMNNGVYTGEYTEVITFTGNYRMPVAQDAKFYNGFLYQGVGYKKATVYKLSFNPVHSVYEVVESYDIPNSGDYELEGVIVNSDNLLITTRLTSDMTKKYFLTVER